MSKIKLRNISLTYKSLILISLSIVFVVFFIVFLSINNSNLNKKESYLQKKYIIKNKINYNIQTNLNLFIIDNYLSFEKLNDISKIQNKFYLVNDTINQYFTQYQAYVESIEENAILEELKSQYQKYQNTVYEIFNQYKQDEINLNLVKRYIDDEFYSYTQIIKSLHNLKNYNDKKYNVLIELIGKKTRRTFIISSLCLILFLIILSSLIIYFFYEDIKLPFKIKKHLDSLAKEGYLKYQIPDNEVNILIDDIRKIEETNNNIKNYLDSLIKGQLEIKIEKKSNKIYASLEQLQLKLKNINTEIEKKKNEDDQKEWANRGLNLFSDIMRRHSNDINTLSDEVLINIVKYLDVAVGGIFIVSEEENEILELVSAFAYDRKKYLSKKIEFGDGLIGTVALDKSSLFLNDIPEDYLQIEAGLGDAPPNSLLIMPLISDNGLMGVIEIASFKFLKDYEIEFVKSLSRSIAATIESVKVNERTKKLLSDSQKQSEELARREKILQETFEEVSKAHEIARKNEVELRGILSGVDQTLLRAEYLPDGKFINSNIVHRKVMGYNIEWMKGKNIFEFIPEEEMDEFKAMWDEISKGKPKQITVKRTNKQTGDTLWLLNNYTPILDEDKKVIKVLYLAIDITEQKFAEEKATELFREAQEKEIELRGVLTGIDRTILRAIYKPDGTFVEANEMHTKVIGYRLEDMVGKSILEFIDEEERADFKKFWEKIERGNPQELIVKRTNKSTGREIWLINQYNPIFDEKGNVIQILYLAIDITKQKLIEQEASLLLEETKKKEIELKGIISGIDRTILRAEYNVNGILIDSNTIHQQVIGYSLSKMKGKSILEFVSDEKEKEEFKKFWEEIKSGIAKELTVKRENKSTGEEIWLINHYNPIIGESGEIYKILYLAIDITEQKKSEEIAQQALTEAKIQQLQSQALINSVDRTVLRSVYSFDGELLESNSLHQQILGYDIEEMKGKSILEFVEEDQVDDFLKMWDEITSGESKELVVKRINKSSGEFVWLHNFYNPILNPKGRVERVLYLAIDMSEQKKSEEVVQDLLLESEKRELEIQQTIGSIDRTVLRAEYNVDGILLDSNDLHEQTLGYDKIDMLGKSIFEFIDTQEHEQFKKMWKDIVSGEFKKMLVKRQNKSIGEDIWLLNYYNPVFNFDGEIEKIIYLAIDVTEYQKDRDRMLEDFQKKEYEIQNILKAEDDIFMRATYDKNLVLKNINAKHIEFFELDKKNVIEKNIIEVLPIEYHQKINEISESLISGQKHSFTISIERKSTKEKVLLDNYFIPLFDEKGEVYLIVCLIKETSSETNLEQELKDSKNKLSNELKNFNNLKNDLSNKFDTDTDKLYDDWLNGFE